MAWNNENAAKGAATGAVLGSALPGVGTVIGAGVGGVLGGTGAGKNLDPTRVKTLPKFQGTEFDQGQKFQTTAEYNPTATYDPKAYTGQYSASGGGQQLNELEKTLGVQAFDGNRFRDARSAAIDSQVARNTAAARRVNDQQAVSSGLGNSGMNRALDQLARSEGDAASIQAKAALEGQVAGMQQNENQFRTGSALSAAGQQLQNTQFGANLGENQAQFGANFQEGQNQFGANFQLNKDTTAQTFDEGQRQFNEQAKYGQELDQYNLNVVAPEQRKEQRKGALLQAGSSLVGAGVGAAGSVAGAAAMCWVAEAVYGVDDYRTHAARFAVMNEWPKHPVTRVLRSLYAKYGQRFAEVVKGSPVLRLVMRVPFAFIWRQGQDARGY